MEKYYCDHCRTLSNTAGKCESCGRDINKKIEIEVQYQTNVWALPKRQ